MNFPSSLRDPHQPDPTLSILDQRRPIHCPYCGELATLSVAEEDFGCRVFWSALFAPQDGADEWCDRIVAGFYEEGLRALRERFGG